MAATTGGGGFFGSFSSIIGGIGGLIDQASGTVGKFIAQRQRIKLASARAQAQLAAAQRQARASAAARVARTKATQRQRSGAGSAITFPASIAGVPTSTIMLIAGAALVYRLVK